MKIIYIILHSLNSICKTSLVDMKLLFQLCSNDGLPLEGIWGLLWSYNSVLILADGNRLFRQRVVLPTVVSQTSLVSSQTCRSQIAKVINIDMSTYVLTVQLGLKFNITNIYTIQNTTLLTRCMRKLLDVNSHSLFPAKVYFLIKWTDKSIGYKQTAILKFLYLNPVL